MTSEEEGEAGDLRNLETVLVASVQENEKKRKEKKDNNNKRSKE